MNPFAQVKSIIDSILITLKTNKYFYIFSLQTLKRKNLLGILISSFFETHFKLKASDKMLRRSIFKYKKKMKIFSYKK